MHDKLQQTAVQQSSINLMDLHLLSPIARELYALILKETWHLVVPSVFTSKVSKAYHNGFEYLPQDFSPLTMSLRLAIKVTQE